MWMKWFPWRYIVKKVARAHGFIDPIVVLSQLHRFAQPSEVAEPLELLRAGVVFHARGLMNTRAIQHNLDWVWPYWVERQFDPTDDSFIPRAFSITHVNLTHRNWTAVGVPNSSQYAVVDPRGLVMPLWDSWSVDSWLIGPSGKELIPSRSKETTQQYDLGEQLSVTTETTSAGMVLRSETRVDAEGKDLFCTITTSAMSSEGGWLVAALRPYNPEGVSFIQEITLNTRESWTVDGTHHLYFSPAPDKVVTSTYTQGDVYYFLHHAEEESLSKRRTVHCSTGMPTAAALFSLTPNVERSITVKIPLKEESTSQIPHQSWKDALAGICTARLPDTHFQFLYDAAVRTLLLHAPHEVYPGPYTYKRFWFRDAAFILYALLLIGAHNRVRRVLDIFPSKQTTEGYFLSQEGEWDSNGEALWIMEKFCSHTDTEPPPQWITSIERGAAWFSHKRILQPGLRHSGLLPAGFSAEHLGPNDYYFWDDYWGAAGLQAAAKLLQKTNSSLAKKYADEGAHLLSSIERSLEILPGRKKTDPIPASPYRRMDSGAIGSIVGGYPLQLLEANDPALFATAEYLFDHCLTEGAFFQDMIHSGVNAYLTLHLAQVFLRAGDKQYEPLLRAVADLASPTGQWPEAIHPRTKGGCMGDGHHVWAAAEWVLIIRNLFVREEEDSLILGSGLLPEWQTSSSPVSFGPTHTSFGQVTVSFQNSSEGLSCSWKASWRTPPPRVVIAVPGYTPTLIATESTYTQLENTVVLKRNTT